MHEGYALPSTGYPSLRLPAGGVWIAEGSSDLKSPTEAEAYL